MTVLVFNVIIHGEEKPRTIACGDWSIIECGAKQCQIHSATAWSAQYPNLNCTFTEFLALIAEGGKIVDVRHLQTIG